MRFVFWSRHLPYTSYQDYRRIRKKSRLLTFYILSPVGQPFLCPGLFFMLSQADFYFVEAYDKKMTTLASWRLSYDQHIENTRETAACRPLNPNEWEVAVVIFLHSILRR
jgi:hypothetical protein